MKKQKSLMTAMTAFVLLLCLSSASRAQSALDGFDPKSNDTVRAIAVQADGKIVIGGNFTTLSPNGGATVFPGHLARLNTDGTMDTSFDPEANGTVYAIAVQPDGKILLGGDFTSLAPNGFPSFARGRIARLNIDGTVDTTFDPSADGGVYSIAVQADGKVLIGGDFGELSPNGGASVIRNRIARLNANGTPDTSFDPNADNDVSTIAVQADGKILFGGSFTTLSPNGGAAVTRNCIARFNANGTLDTSFDPNADNFIYSIAVQADGNIVIGGGFSALSANGGMSVTRNRIARLNPDGTLDTSFDPNASSTVYTVAVQADGKLVLGGDFTTIAPNGAGTVTRNHVARLNLDGTLDPSFNPNADGIVTSIAQQADGKLVLGGDFLNLAPNGGATVPRNYIARLNLDGTLDRTLNNPSANGLVFATAVQSDGKILVGGGFTSFLSVTRNCIARLNADGTLDTSFNPNANNGVYAVAVQADGKILIGGDFTALGPNGGATVTRNRIARLNADGTLDTSFDPNANRTVRSIAVETDGRILMGGDFTTLAPNGGATVTRNFIARMNADGTLDSSFDPNANSAINSIARQADGKILIGGYFTTLTPNGGAAVTRNRIARLNPDGTLDTSFDPNADRQVYAVAVQADGKVVLSGYFNTLAPNGGPAVRRPYLARLNADGTVDTSFDPGVDNFIYSIAVQADGKILIGGDFTFLSPNGGAIVTRNKIARLNADGTVNTPFNPNAGRTGSSVFSIALLADGKILVGGSFTSIGGQTRSNFARLTNDTAALQNLAVTRTSITWTLGGASPQFSRVTFEYSTDNVNYSSLGSGTRSGNTWSLTGLSLSALQNIYVRARGYYPGGYYDGSESIRESVRNAYPAKSDQTITVGTHAPASAAYNASFTVAATSDSGLAVSYSSSGACTNVGATFTMTSSTGTCTVKYDQTGDSNYNAASQVTESVTAQKANQTITVGMHAPANATFNSQFTVAATSNSGLAVSYSSSGVCSNVGATFTMTSGTGACTVKYDQAGDSNYSGATQLTESVTAQKGNQTITVNPHAPANATYNDSFTVAATSNSGLAVGYSSSGICTNIGATFTMTSGTGTCTVKYDQAGNNDFNAAPQVTESVSAQKTNQTITFGALANRTFGDADFAVSASASSNLTVGFNASGNCTLSGSTVHLSGAGSCTITASQAGDSNYNAAANVPQSFSVAKAATTTAATSSLNPSNLSQSVTFTATVSSIAGTPAGTVQFKDNGTNLGSPVTLNGSGVATFSTSSLAGGTHIITADYSGDVNFSTSSGTLSGGQTVNNNQPLISFSKSSYTVSEDAHFVDITVNRAGDTSSAVNVDYTTDDTNASTNCATLNSGRASSRCDFTPAFGTLRFAANETAKTFSVLITQDSHVEGPEMFNLNLSNLTGGAAFVAPSTATVTINDGVAVLPANPIDDPTTFVRQHYHDFLNREPDQAGLDFWVSNFTQCNGDPQCLEVKRINVSAAFFLSIEFQQTGYLVERIYKTALRDALGTSTFPSSHTLPVPRVRFNEFLADTQNIGRGVVVGQPGWEQQLESNKQAFTAEFAQRGNFPGVGSPLSNAQFVDTLNSNAGNPLSQSERDQLVADLNNSSKTRAQALRTVAEHPNLATAEFNRAFVLMQFFGYLRRNPNDPQDTDHTGYDFWLTKLNQFNGNFQNAEMVKAFITSIEYRRRFGQ